MARAAQRQRSAAFLAAIDEGICTEKSFGCRNETFQRKIATGEIYTFFRLCPLPQKPILREKKLGKRCIPENGRTIGCATDGFPKQLEKRESAAFLYFFKKELANLKMNCIIKI